MAKKIENCTFEEALEGLENAVDALQAGNATLDERIGQYREGMACYERCKALLSEAEGKVECYNKEQDALEEFEP